MEIVKSYKSKHIQKDVALKPIREVAELSQRAKNVLLVTGIKTAGELFQYFQQDLLKFGNMGKKSIDGIENFKSNIKRLSSSI